MPRKKTLEQARYILQAGKLIQDRVLRAHAAGHRTSSDAGNGAVELSMSQVHAVRAARDRGEITISELAEVLGVSPPSASAMVDRLVDKGILDRKQSREDRRKVLVSVSPEAAKRVDTIEEAILGSFVDLVEKIGPEATRKWCEVLERIQEVHEQEHRATRTSATSGR